MTGKNWTTGFEDDQKVIDSRAKALFDGQVSSDALRALTQWTLQYIGVTDFFGDMDNHNFRFRSQPINPEQLQAFDDPLNSFLLDDLANVADNIGDNRTSKPLDQYLSLHDEKSRLHIDDDRASLPLIEQLMPDSYPMSSWPSEDHLGLVHSQQLAVNSILGTLGNAHGLLGINGPPGTGKTTLLRDLIASIVTSRADELAKLSRASDGFLQNGREAANDEGKQQTCYKLNPALIGFEIVAASSNNGAVENVTHELPQRDKIDESWLPEAEYFPELGELVSGKPAWGLVSGALGSKTRRSNFVRGYFFGEQPFGSKEKEDPASKEHTSFESHDKLGDAPGNLTSPPSSTDDTHQDYADTQQDKEAGPKGLLGWLNVWANSNTSRSPEQRQTLWQQAVSEFEETKVDVRNLCAAANGIRESIQHLCRLRKEIKDQSETLYDIETKLTETTNQLAHLDTEEIRPANIALRQCLDAIEQHQARKPSFWANLFSLWSAQRSWEVRHKLLEGQHDLTRSEFDRIARQIRQLDTLRESLDKRVADIRRALRRSRNESQLQQVEVTNLARTCGAVHLLAWLQEGRIGSDDAIELAEPWRIEGWRQARAKVFIQALKLHQIFFELEASRMRSNLFLINRMLTGSSYQGISHDAIRSAWASLFMVVPVLSSTFSSFARSFGSWGAGEIGWLLVDEAGQAPPQAAVGALWRSKRALLVGDPWQLKPIVTVSDAALEHMRTRYQVDVHWLPNRQSAQTLADEATTLGRMAGPADGKCWVGLPLVVHRRCDRPMYELANRIAYDDAMVFGTITPSPQNETHTSLPTGWIQASGTSEGNWVNAEGKALEILLARLRQDGVVTEDISVITPFKDVEENLKRLLCDKMVFGTIHTMQGKEASIVILVLGGNTAGSGARNWVVSEPNLLNVAATRAKRRFYVIGDRNDWENRSLFCKVMDLLPIQPLLPHEQEQITLIP